MTGDLRTKPGLIGIKLRAEVDYSLCEMSNNGPPIKTEDADRIFEAFFSTKEERRGTGLGLSIAREVIEHHHSGTLTLDKTDPVTFVIRLPFKQ